MIKLKKAAATTVAGAILAGGALVAAPTAAQASIFFDPTVKIGQKCPATYAKGVLNRYRYMLRMDAAAWCLYGVYEYGYYTGSTHKFWKQY